LQNASAELAKGKVELMDLKSAQLIAGKWCKGSSTDTITAVEKASNGD
jgi:hypothetical protein